MKLCFWSKLKFIQKIVYFEKLQTAWSGLCYNITVDFHIIGRPFFHLKFSESLDSKDIPVPKIYLTSYENAEGIIGHRWNNGEEYHTVLEGSVS